MIDSKELTHVRIVRPPEAGEADEFVVVWAGSDPHDCYVEMSDKTRCAIVGTRANRDDARALAKNASDTAYVIHRDTLALVP